MGNGTQKFEGGFLKIIKCIIENKISSMILNIKI